MDGNQETIKDRTHVTIHVQIWAQHQAKCESTGGDSNDGSDKRGNSGGDPLAAPWGGQGRSYRRGWN